MLQRTIDTARFLRSDPIRTARSGRTPHRTIFTQGKSSLRYFPVPEGQTVNCPPVLISMPLINTWTVWDLLPGRSVVEGLTGAGVPVYLVDWGRAGPEDAHRPLSWYLDDVLNRLVDRAERHAAVHCGGSKLDAIGYCVGGTFLAIHASRNPERFRQAAFVCTPIDFHKSGRLATWANPETFPLDAIVAGPRNFDGWRMADSFAWLRPAGATRKWMSLWERIDRDDFPELWAALEKWSRDAVDFPGLAYREYVRQCYFDNALIAGGWVLGTQTVDLQRAKIPALAITADGDHIAPTESCAALADAWGGSVEVQTIAGGHVGVSIGSALPAALVAWSGR